MCGISGIWALNASRSQEALEALAKDMAARLQHRGPDDSGVWADAQKGIALSHRRLSIIDLSQQGAQPMISASGRYVLSYNGEIYNFRSLRKQLDYPWQSQSDTEVVLAAIEAWGLEKTLQQLNGMFAFALWDVQKQELTLARDRMGEKPLYYGQSNGDFVFASELKALQALPDFAPAIDRTALTQLMRYSYVPSPRSIYEGIAKLKPAHYVTIDAQGKAKEISYWSFANMAQQGAANRLTLGEDELAEQLEALLKEAVGLRMIADVPLGAFLSGGIDSSLIVAMMQAQSSQPVKSFSIGFAEAGFDEAPYAKAVAQHLGTDHTELYVSAQDALDVVPQLAGLYDEPFADPSQIPTFLVSQMAKEHVTVALSGDAGDELFGGYNRHVSAAKYWQLASHVPQSVRHMGARYGLKPLMQLLNQMFGMSPKTNKLFASACKLDAKDEAAFYRALCSLSQRPEALVLGGADEALPYAEAPDDMVFAEWMMLQDALTYLPHDILTKVDRAAMGVSLETRIPFLDPDVMAFAWQLPLSMKIRDGKGKWLLREVLHKHVPKELIERPKAGFAIPLAEWLRGALKNWMCDLLAPEHVQTQGYLCAQQTQKLVMQHLSGKYDHSSELWNLLMFQSWLMSQPNHK